MSLSAARGAAEKALARVTLGESPQAERRASKVQAKADTTLDAICERFVTEYAKPRQKAWEQGDALRRRYVLPKLGSRPIADIKRADVRAIFNDLTSVRKTPVLANQVLAAMAAVSSRAVKQDILEHDPARGIMRNPTPSRERVPPEAESWS